MWGIFYITKTTDPIVRKIVLMRQREKTVQISVTVTPNQEGLKK